MKSTLKKFLSITLVVSMLMSMCTFAFATWENQVVSNGELVTTKDGMVKHSKMIEQKGENEFKITLKVQTKEDITNQTVSQDAAVVLVLDVSNSMVNDGRNDIENARNAANGFVEKFIANAGDGQRKVAVVEFGSNAKTVLGWTDAKSDAPNVVNTDVTTAIGNVSNKFSYDVMCEQTGAHTHRENIKRSVSDIKYSNEYSCWYCSYCNKPVSWNGQNNKPQYINHSCKGNVSYTGTHVLSTETDGGGTNMEGALRLANNLLGLSAVSEIQNTYVVLMTDGVPSFHVADADETDSTTFMKGTQGGGSEAYHDDYHDIYCTRTDKGQNHVQHGDNIPQQIKNKGAKIYTVSYKTDNVTDKVNTMNIDAWLAAFATQNVSAGDNIFSGLGNIAQIIVNQAQAWTLTDPMGEYINFVSGDSVAADNSSDAVRKFNTDTKTLTWDLKNDATRTGPVDGWYTYTMSYNITLDTAAESFDESKNYATNGTTALTYMLTDENGQLQPDLKDTELVVPVVEGKVPEYPYTIEYYKQEDAKQGDYENYTKVKTTDGEKTDLHTVISLTDKDAGYETKYDKDNYHFATANTQITISATPSANVIKVYYDKDTTGATINTFYKLKTIDANGNVTYAPVSGSDAYGTTADVSSAVSQTLYVGENYSYSAPETSTYGDVTYTLDTAATTASISSLSATAADNVINVYYKAVVDQRADATVVVNHTYNTYSYQLQNDSYVKYLANSADVDQVEGPVNKKATESYTASSAAVDGKTGFTLITPEADRTITLTEGPNAIELVFEKTDDNRGDPVNVNVVHHYTKTVTTIVDGAVSTSSTSATSSDPAVSKYVGETYTVSQNTTYGGETYVADSGNADKLSGTVFAGGNTIDLYYTLVETPATTTVTEYHHYRTNTTVTEQKTREVTVVDEETGEETTQTEVYYENKTVTVDDVDEVTSNALYVGQSYTAQIKTTSGFTFTDANPSNRTVKALANNASKIHLYYDQNADERDDANINVRHVYTTHLTTIVDGAVSTVDVADGSVYDATSKVTGKVGGSYSFETQTAYNDNVYTVVGTPVLSGTMNVPGQNPDVVINYERSASDLVPTTYTVDYNYKTYTMFVDTDGVAKYPTEPTVETGTPVNGTGYVAQVVTIANGAREGFTADTTNPATSQTLAASDNAYTFNHVKYVPLSTGSVQVNHHYTTNTIAADGSRSSSTSDTIGTPTTKYVGEAYSAAAVLNGFTQTEVKVNNTAVETAATVTGTVAGAEVIDFYYTRTDDQRTPATYTVQHVYKTYDWDGTLLGINEPTATTGSSYVGHTVSTAANTLDDQFTLVSVTYNGEAVATDNYTITMANDANAVVYTYEKHSDTRDDKDVSVKVIHNYFKRDTYTTDEALSNEDFIKDAAAEYVTEMNVVGKDNGIWIGNSYTAEKVLSYTVGEGDEAKTLTYEFVNADPESMKVELTKAGEYVITINYLREYSTDPGDTSYVVTHVYCRNGVEETRVTGTPIVGKVGSVVNASDIGKITENNGRTYRFVSASPESITLEKDVVGELILTYNRTTGGGGGGGGYTPTPKPDPIPEPPVDDEEIVDEDVPLAALPVPGDEELEDFEEEEVPLANVPKTSDMALFWLASSTLSGIGLGALNLKKREDEDEQ